MDRLKPNNLLTQVEFDNEVLNLDYRETVTIKNYPGLECDVYGVKGSSKIDFAVVRLDAGSTTPPQEVERVADQQRTVERYVKGNGRLIVVRADGSVELYEISNHSRVPLNVEVGVGDTMQWQADQFSKLEIQEFCIPPYAEGRFTNKESLFPAPTIQNLEGDS